MLVLQSPRSGRFQVRCVVFLPKQIVDYLGESVDENLTVTGSGSEFDGDDSDCVFQSSDSESEDQNTDTASGLREKRPRVQSIWEWKKVDDSYKGSKIPFSGNREAIHRVQGVSEAFKLFFDDALKSQIANKTNRYARESSPMVHGT